LAAQAAGRGDGAHPGLNPAHLRHAPPARPAFGQRRGVRRAAAAAMSAALAMRADDDAEGEAIVVGAEITAGHDGAADLVVRLRYENGVVGSLVLDPQTGFDLLTAAGAASLDELAGWRWRELLREL